MAKRSFLTLAALLLTLTSWPGQTMAQADKKSLSWSIRHNEWGRLHREKYQEFISRIGDARERGLCFTTDQCLRDPRANPLYASRNPENLRSIFADCADLPHVLMAYFSWMNDLPFSYTRGVSKARWRIEEIEARIAEVDGGRSSRLFGGNSEVRALRRELKEVQERISKEDIRYTRDGNSVRERRAVRNGDSINEILQDVVVTVSTATYRIHANRYDSGPLFKDMYHVALDGRHIVPGTILYDPAGHIAVVYKVTDDGRVHMIDAHPDNSLTRVSFGEKFGRSPDVRGAGFVNFRPYRLVGARFDLLSGTYQGGQIVAQSNAEIDGFSLEQFYGAPQRPGVSVSQSRFMIDGRSYSYHDYVRRKLSKGELIVNPVNDFKVALDDLCSDMMDRKDAVDKAITDRIHLMDSPNRLPENIYGTHGRWEVYSTPSRDARLKAAVREAYEKVHEGVALYRQGSREVRYTGGNIIGDIHDVFEEVAKGCEIEFTGSQGRAITLNLEEMIEKLFDLSFDPYHCIELRWGLTDANSLRECGQDQTKMAWYRAQQRLRNTIERDYALRMDYTLRELPSAPIGTNERPVFRLPR
jgi:hypothetical protein